MADDSAAAAAEAKDATETAAAATAEGKEEGDGKKKKRKRWFPLESNPDVINKYLAKLGFPVTMYEAVEVMSTDDWALDMVPKPVVGVLMLFPIKDASEAHKAAEDARIKAEGQTLAPEVWYTKQTVGNACGTIGLVHIAANVTSFAGSDVVPISDDSWLHKFLSRTKDMNPDERAKALEEDDDLEEAHEGAAQEGDTKVPERDESVNAHFVAFTNVKGQLYELDGRKSFPVNHGATSAETLLEDAAKVVRGFIERDPGELRFTIVALAAASGGAAGVEGAGAGDEDAALAAAMAASMADA